MNTDEIKLGRAEDLTGKVFGYLKPLYRVKNIGKHTAWKCKCLKCGNFTNVRIDHLKENRVVSCGCFNKEKASQHLREINKKGKNMKNITGLRSGWLIALEPTEKRISYSEKNSHVVWKCQCLNPIHNIPVFCEATTTALTTKNKTSCGCISSKGEAKIISLLIDNNITFEQQKSFDSCRNPKTNALLKFDFYVNNQYLIEFDGKQHFEELNNHWENLNTIQERDMIKNKWCKQNNIPLIRIPYTKINNLKIEDLLIEKSDYIWMK